MPSSMWIGHMPGQQDARGITKEYSVLPDRPGTAAQAFAEALWLADMAQAKKEMEELQAEPRPRGGFGG